MSRYNKPYQSEGIIRQNPNDEGITNQREKPVDKCASWNRLMKKHVQPVEVQESSALVARQVRYTKKRNPRTYARWREAYIPKNKSISQVRYNPRRSVQDTRDLHKMMDENEVEVLLL